MSGYVWSTMRDAFIARVGAAPSPHTEQELLDLFDEHPELIEQALDHVASRYERGLIHTPWPIVSKHVSEMVAVASRAADARSDGSTERARRVARAKQWMRAAGVHFGRDSEITDELFHSPGAMLGPYKDDEELREQMLVLWRRLRPYGERVEADAIRRAQAYIEWRATENERQGS